jgi:ATP phosphoribosyltransferase
MHSNCGSGTDRVIGAHAYTYQDQLQKSWSFCIEEEGIDMTNTLTTAERATAGNETTAALRMLLPTGRIQEKVLTLLSQIGINLSTKNRCYKPLCKESGIEAKMVKGQNIPSLVALGRQDCGFSGYDWVLEQDANVVELLDLGFDPVQIVAAIPEELAAKGRDVWSAKKSLIIASEYRRLTEKYIEQNKLDAVFLQTFGATEALPPEDADMIVDNTATGSTLSANRLVIVDEIMQSTTRFICNAAALEDPVKKKALDEIVLLMKSTLRARQKVLIEMNVDAKDFERVVANAPCMRAPTVSELYGGQGYAIKIAVPTSEVKDLIPKLVALGARDILEYKLEKIVI